jgi:hypothetical protein
MKERIPIGSPVLKQIAYLGLGDTTLELLDYADPAPPDSSIRVGYRLMALEADSMEESLAFLAERGYRAQSATYGCRRRVFAGGDHGPGRAFHRAEAVVGEFV